MPGFRYHQGGMAWGRGLFVLLVIVLVLAAVAWFAMNVSRQSRRHHGLMPSSDAASPKSSDALKILDERFARGEIDAEEFTKRRDLLRSPT